MICVYNQIRLLKMSQVHSLVLVSLSHAGNYGYFHTDVKENPKRSNRHPWMCSNTGCTPLVQSFCQQWCVFGAVSSLVQCEKDCFALLIKMEI